MSDVMFTNVRIFDGGGEAPFNGDVLVQGNRISRVKNSSTPKNSSESWIGNATAVRRPALAAISRRASSTA